MLDLKNEFIMPPIKLGYSIGDGKVTDRHITFYKTRSRYLGAIAIEPMYLDRGLREIPNQLGIDSDDKISGLKKLVDVIHETDAKVIAHLNHPGRMANPKIPGNYFISSTDKPCENGGATPKRADYKDLEYVETLFVDAARRAAEAGFDIIELQFGHGYLLAQFLSPSVNDRKDEFNGSLKDRAVFPLQILKAVKSEVNLPIIARISGDEMIPNGIKIDESIEFTKILSREGVEAVHVSAGTVCLTPPWFFQHMFIEKGRTWDLASRIKGEVDTPIIFVGKINRFEDIDRLKKDFKADYIAVGRALLADPDFIGKYLGEIPSPYRPCLSCSDGCLGGVKSGSGLGCAMNPLVGRDDYRIEETSNPRNIAVVGGGLAGMEAATLLARRGHNVTLYEKDKLGGQFNLASLPPGKEELSHIIDYYEKALEYYHVNVIFKEVDEKEILSNNYDIVILATGSKPAIPPIEGLEKYMWAEVLKEENLVRDSKVAVIGGGLIGIEVAHKLLKHGNEVIVIEMLSEIARGMEMIEKTLTLKGFKDSPIRIYTDTRVTKVEGDKLYIDGKERGVIEGVDHIIIATGMKSYNPLEEKLKGKIPVYVVGDAKKVGKAKDAIEDAFEIASRL